MYTIKNKTGSSALVWDSTLNTLLEFKNGRYVTDDKAQADRFKALGFEVESSGKKKAESKI